MTHPPSQTLRVLHCMPYMAVGGAERQLIYLCRELVNRGVQIHVALSAKGPQDDALRETGAVLHFLLASSNHSPSLLFELLKVVKKVQPSILQTWLRQMDVLGGITAQILGVPWILSERSSEKSYNLSFKHWLRRQLGRKSSAIIANSQGGREYWARVRGSDENLFVIRNILPLQEIDEQPPLTASEAQLKSSENLALFVGRLCPGKNIASFLQALGMVQEYVSLNAAIIGDGPEMRCARGLVQTLGLAHKVRFLGHRTDVWRWMKRADLYVSLSSFEGNPNSVLEAMACGCPLVLSDIQAHRELLSPEAACFVDERSPVSIAEAIVRLLVRKEVGRSQAGLARARAESLLHENSSDKYLQIYRQLAVAKRPNGLRDGSFTETKICVE